MHMISLMSQVAFQQADYAAWNIWAAIHNRPLLPFRYQHLGDMMSLGRDFQFFSLKTCPIMLRFLQV